MRHVTYLKEERDRSRADRHTSTAAGLRARRFSPIKRREALKKLEELEERFPSVPYRATSENAKLFVRLGCCSFDRDSRRVSFCRRKHVGGVKSRIVRARSSRNLSEATSTRREAATAFEASAVSDAGAAGAARRVAPDRQRSEADLASDTPKYHCDSCTEDLGSEAALLLHRTERSIRKTREVLRGAAKRYECDNCCESFARKIQLVKHRRDRCDNPATIARRREARRSSASPRENIEGEKIEENAGRDDRVTDGDGSCPPSGPGIRCNVCHKVFKKKKYLNVHKTLHGAPRICHVCGAKLTSEYYLKIHIRRHNKEFTEFCKVCNKGFYLKATLKTHMSVHTDDKPCTCEICHKSFGNRVYLRSHMKIHSLPEDRKKYKCEICAFETFYSYCYKEHLWTHTGESQVACEFCGKLIRRQYMKIHIRIHTGEKPEICEYCGKAFGSRKYLIKHRRTHTGERPYKCRICDKRFTQRGTLSAHLRRHEGGE